MIYLGSRSLFREKWLESAGYFDKILFSPGIFSGIDLLLDQVMFGGVGVTGIMPFAEKLTLKGFGSVTYDKLRIGYGFPGLVQMSRDTLQKIDSILNVAVKKSVEDAKKLVDNQIEEVKQVQVNLMQDMQKLNGAMMQMGENV